MERLQGSLGISEDGRPTPGKVLVAGGASARKRLRAVDPPKGARDLVASIPQGAGRSPPGNNAEVGSWPRPGGTQALLFCQ